MNDEPQPQQALTSIIGKIIQKRKRSQWYVLSLSLEASFPSIMNDDKEGNETPTMNANDVIGITKETRSCHHIVTDDDVVVVVYVPRYQHRSRHQHSSNRDDANADANGDDDVDKDDSNDVVYFLHSIVQVRGYFVDRLPPTESIDQNHHDHHHSHVEVSTASSKYGHPSPAPQSQQLHTKRIDKFFLVQHISLRQCAPNIRAILILLRQYKRKHTSSPHRSDTDIANNTDSNIVSPPLRLPPPSPPDISVLIPFAFHPPTPSSVATSQSSTDHTSTENATAVHYYEYLYRTIAINLQHHYDYSSDTFGRVNTAETIVPFKTVAKLQQFILRGLQNQLVLVEETGNNGTIDVDNGTTTTTNKVVRRSRQNHRQRIPRPSKSDIQLLERMENLLMNHNNSNDHMMRSILLTPIFEPVVAAYDTKQDIELNQPNNVDKCNVSSSSTTDSGPDANCNLYDIDYTKIVDILFYNSEMDQNNNYNNDHENEYSNRCHYEDDHDIDTICDCMENGIVNDEPLHHGVTPQHSSRMVTDYDFTLSSKQQKSSRGSLTRYEYYIQKKIPQIQYMIQRIVKLLVNSREPANGHDHHNIQKSTNESLTTYSILDVGGGRGDLSILLAYTLIVLRSRSSTCESNAMFIPTQFHITVVDKNQQSLRIGEQYSKHIFQSLLGLDYRTFLKFRCCDFITEYIHTPISTAAIANPPMTHNINHIKLQNLSPVHESFDLIVALHACGDLTDAALYFATNVCFQSASSREPPSFILCPCCYNKSCIYKDFERLAEPTFVPPYFHFQYSPNQAVAHTDDVGRTTTNTSSEYECAAKRSKIGIVTNRIDPSWIKTMQKLAELSQVFSVCRRAAIIINSLRIHYSKTMSKVFIDFNTDANNTTTLVESDIISTGHEKSHKVNTTKMTIQLEEFSSSYSRRNIVIVGSYHKE